jgi:hypothetical protein
LGVKAGLLSTATIWDGATTGMGYLFPFDIPDHPLRLERLVKYVRATMVHPGHQIQHGAVEDNGAGVQIARLTRQQCAVFMDNSSNPLSLLKQPIAAIIAKNDRFSHRARSPA